MTKFPKGSYIVREGSRRKVLEELGELRFLSMRENSMRGWEITTSYTPHIQELEREGWKVEEVEEEWKPKKNDWYFSVGNEGEAVSCYWSDHRADEARFKVGNCYPTREAAEAAAARVKKAYRGE